LFDNRLVTYDAFPCSTSPLLEPNSPESFRQVPFMANPTQEAGNHQTTVAGQGRQPLPIQSTGVVGLDAQARIVVSDLVMVLVAHFPQVAMSSTQRF
jgi:hypothetical protein